MMLLSVERVLICKTVHMFADLRDEQLMELAAGMHERRCAAGDVLIREGDSGRSIFIIVSGEVDVLRDGKRLAHLGEREVVGELAAFDPHPRSATVRATSECHLLELDNEHLEMLMAHDMEMLRAVVRVLCRRLRAAEPGSQHG